MLSDIYFSLLLSYGNCNRDARAMAFLAFNVHYIRLVVINPQPFDGRPQADTLAFSFSDGVKSFLVHSNPIVRNDQLNAVFRA